MSPAIRVGKNRVLRLMREHGLLAPAAAGASPWRPDPQRPDVDREGRTNSGARTPRGSGRRAVGWCWFFAAVDHCTSDIVGWDVAKKGNPRAALEPARQGVCGMPRRAMRKAVASPSFGPAASCPSGNRLGSRSSKENPLLPLSLVS